MSLLVMNVSQLCLCKYTRLKTIRWHVLLKKQKINTVSKGGLDPLVSLVIHRLYKEFSDKHLIIFTVYNSKCISYSSNSKQ